MQRALSRKNLWENAPRPVRRFVGGVLGLLPPSWLMGRGFRRQLAFVQRAQWWSRAEAEAYQFQQIRRIVSLAYDRAPAWRRRLADAGMEPGDIRTLDDVSSLPLIDKLTVINDGEAMCTRAPDAGGVDYVTTGGTSGRQLRFYINADRSASEYAHLLSSWMRAGYRPELAQAVLRGKVIDEDATGLRHSYDPILRRHSYGNFHMNDESMERYLRHMRGIGPFYLHGYPSALAVLARYVRRTGAEVPTNLVGLLAGSENVYAAERRRVEDVFGVRYYSWYGHSEKLVLAAECEQSQDYHVWPTYGYFELVDELGRVISEPGRSGEIVGTGFINSVMPMIRYRTGDYATYVADSCEACGRQHPVIRDVRGHREREFLVAADGAAVSWTAINVHDDTFDRLHSYQFRQDEPGRAILRIVPTQEFGEADLQRVHQRLELRLSGRIAFEVQIVDRIEQTVSGKTNYVDQRIDMSTLVMCEGAAP